MKIPLLHQKNKKDAVRRHHIALVMFLSDFTAIFITCANLRAVAQGSYFWTAVTEPTLAFGCFILFKLMRDRDEWCTWTAGLAGALGATAGSLLSIFVTTHFYGK
jgi:hypothetical protein